MTTLLELSAYCTYSLDDDIHHKPGNDLRAAPHGLCILADIPFQIDGLIQLSGKISHEKTGESFPESALGIPVGAMSKRMHFLQSSSWRGPDGSVIGEYRVHYDDGDVAVIPIVYGHSVVDWWFTAGDPLPTDAAIAWNGANERTEDLGHLIQLYAFTWSNPRPDALIATLDFVSLGKESAPFLMAVTLD
ncbi:hypothetical protein [Demequina lutea]|uniref:Uncharacterized protein n=1 Tax=Demequina lutea TaxID=431489 RepID=A0A7Z0CLK2_9MICO|nr:hypothetical protein [Demequina lutea]NYI42840.1 hypothetical protein [Demequina lutea]